MCTRGTYQVASNLGRHWISELLGLHILPGLLAWFAWHAWGMSPACLACLACLAWLGLHALPGLPGLPGLPTLPALLVCEVLQLSKPSLSENFFFASELLNGSFWILATWPTGW